MLSRRFLRIKVVKSVYAHFKSASESIAVSEKSLIKSIDKAYDLYYQMLELAVDVGRYAAERLEIARNKKLPTYEDLHPNTKFVDNRIIERLENDRKFNEHLKKNGLGWSNYPELIRQLYTQMTASDYYHEYMNRNERSLRDDARLLSLFYERTVQDNELLEAVVEEQSILWCDDIDFSLIMVLRTLDACRANQTEIPILPQFQSEDDLRFAKELFRKTLLGFDESLKYIERFTQNWDVERIAYLDNIIMATAMAELLGFESIPVKVTLDEYIDIAKYYSTPGSSLFINGVLDKIVESLKAEGRIVKTGRGLIETTV